jgi:hypothetical protein
VRHGAHRSLLKAAGLWSACVVRNGILLCPTCHLFFDKHLWSIDDSEVGRMVVAGGLLADDEFGEHFSRLVGEPLRMPAEARGDSWPSAQTWAYHRELFIKAQEKRRAEFANANFVCFVCGATYQQAGRYQYHVRTEGECERRVRRAGKTFFTPVETSAYPALADAARAEDMEGVARRLTLHEDGAAAEGDDAPGDDSEGTGGVD